MKIHILSMVNVDVNLALLLVEEVVSTSMSVMTLPMDVMLLQTVLILLVAMNVVVGMDLVIIILLCPGDSAAKQMSADLGHTIVT
jgi:hypothetical protein